MFRWIKLAKRVSELEDLCLRFTRVIENHDLEMADMRARCKRMLDRAEKAQKRVLESESQSTAQGETAAVDGNGMGATPGRLLTPRQLAIQQNILTRRKTQ